MGYPVNTPDNDIFIVISKDGKRAYYSSVREDAIGYDDIYLINLTEDAVAEKQPEPKQPDPEPEKEPEKDPEPPVKEPVKEPVKLVPLVYTVSVVESGSKLPIDARVTLQGAKDNVAVGSSPKGNGVYEFTISANGQKDYRLSVESEGYVFINQTISLPGASETAKTMSRTVEMQRLAREVSGVLRNIYFDFDRATFKQESYNELNKLERMMQQNSNLKVEISGHTDAVGSKTYNKQLSQRRAEAVKDFLTKKGIDSRRITAVGYGETKPLVSNDDEQEGREINRRVEFKVIGN
jgi:outer membrane protein OmpA-like peptidoglycan-associated protein